MEQENVQNVETTTENTDTQTAEQNEVKTFTQEEVNAIVQERLAKSKKGMPSQEELKAFNEWKDSQKTETEKSLEKDKEIERLTKENAILTNSNLIANANVDAKFQKFVLSEVSEMEGNFEDNLKDYLKDNPQYLQSVTETSKNTGVGVTKINNSEEDGVLAILKAKHPNAF